jgi:hypothetical protein
MYAEIEYKTCEEDVRVFLAVIPAPYRVRDKLRRESKTLCFKDNGFPITTSGMTANGFFQKLFYVKDLYRIYWYIAGK